ncbi:MAG: ABC transporter ATP-binding protein [SAR202 cluster bacterium]|nr:ABC transporter ATP-binding protein [SAR202 cluster bacterium]
MAQVANVIEVRGLVKTFGSLRAVDGVSFEVAQGEVFGILGPNGAGKTTAFECIEGLQAPTSGSAFVLGMDTQRDALRVKERIGVQLQASAYFDYLTLTEILELFGRFYDRRLSPVELLAKVGLQEKSKSTVGNLSGGQRQRFSIAATLVNDPEVVFLDEPTTGLDPQARRSLWELVEQVHREGRTVVLTTHYMEEAEVLCQRVAIMDRGRIVALDSPLNLVHALPTPYVVRLQSPVPLPLEALRGLPSVQAAEHSGDSFYTMKVKDAAGSVSALVEWARSHQVSLGHLEVKPATLDEVFLTLTGRELRD